MAAAPRAQTRVWLYKSLPSRPAVPTMISSRTVLLIASGLAAARAQGIGSLPTADIACAGRKLAPRVDRVNSLCCGDGRAECTCTIACSSALLPLLDECRTVLDIMLDIGDGVRDGVAGQLDVLKAQCLDMPPALVLGELKEMHDAGRCSDAMLNNVARTDVATASCVDTNKHCDALLGAGYTCSDSDGALPSVGRVCQETCGTCGQGGHRRAQDGLCADKRFHDEADAVNTACCDYEGCTGVPTTCDAKCAIAFNGFFDRCAATLEGLGLQWPQYRALHVTCATLPVEPLLRAVIACSA